MQLAKSVAVVERASVSPTNKGTGTVVVAVVVVAGMATVVAGMATVGSSAVVLVVVAVKGVGVGVAVVTVAVLVLASAGTVLDRVALP